jgi:hypothetical protein
MSLLTRDAILQAEDAKIASVDVPEWGGHVFLRVMSGTERDDFEAETYVTRGRSVELNRHNFRARLLVRCICDDKGEPIFTRKDIDALGKKSAKALDRAFSVAQKLNGLSADDVEELTKN